VGTMAGDAGACSQASRSSPELVASNPKLHLRFRLIVLNSLVAMNFIIHVDHYLGECRLTSEDFHGFRKRAPTLIIADCAYRPNDVVDIHGKWVVAARLVLEWATKGDRTEAEVDAAQRYLSLWPNGPQLKQVNTPKPQQVELPAWAF
jgi:hypothetical protein